MSLEIENIDALAELEAAGWEYEPAGDDEVRLCCPAHDDKSPSAMLNLTKNLWNCKAAECGAKGDIVSLLALIARCERYVMIHTLSERYDLGNVKTIDIARVEKFHKAIWDAPLRKRLYERGITDDMIRDARIGFDRGRITIPIFDTQGRCINVRRYLPGAPGPQKMKNTRGHGDPAIYQPDQLKYDTVWVMGGEMKALVVKHLLNRSKIGAISVTAGEGAWDTAYSRMLQGKRVYLGFDVDAGGREAADKIAAMTVQYAEFVGVLHWPLDPDKYPKGDINDWVGREGAEAKDLKKLMKATEAWKPPVFDEEPEDDTPAEDATLQDISHAKMVGKRVSVKAVIQAVDDQPYLVPKVVRCHCKRDQPLCLHCPVYVEKPDERGFTELTVNQKSPAILSMVGAPKKSQRELTMEALRMPPCKVVKLRTVEHYNVEDVRLSPRLELSNQRGQDVIMPAFMLAHGSESNTPYDMEGIVHPSPRNQQALFLVDEASASEDALSSFKPANGELDSMSIFRPSAWTVEALSAKLDEIYDDLEANVTRIFDRRDLHLVIDLVYHSPLFLEWDGRTVKGWAEALILGDSSQGKTEATSLLMDHYRLGERVSCKNASVAGLVGGLQQSGTRWFVTWGKIPQHDRRLVILEELKGASEEVLSKLTDMRSTGIVEVQKIQQRKSFARTRLIMISNPRSNRPMNAFGFGVEAIKELIGGPEDIRRFDLAILLSNTQISVDRMTEIQRLRPQVDHAFTSDVCHRLVLWGWTRRGKQVKISDHVSALILERAAELCSKFNEGIVPLVDRGSMRHKIARLAAALAVRTFSTDKGRKNLVVRDCHVEYVVQFLDRLYSDPVFGYLDFSKAADAAKELRDPDAIRRHIITNVKYPADFVEALLYTSDISVTDICDWCELDKDEAHALISFFVRKRAFERRRRNYIKTSRFIEFLKKLQGEGLPENADADNKEEY